MERDNELAAFVTGTVQHARVFVRRLRYLASSTDQSGSETIRYVYDGDDNLITTIYADGTQADQPLR